MIPVKLTIKGLYSYQKEQTIDFTKLTAANLFGIFGSVGSGKSSVLEAITFALYGKTDRLNLSGDNRNYNMMNLKSNELLIDFEFETGKNQDAYRATVKSRRNSKRFDDVKTLERTAYKKVAENWIPLDTVELEAAIGLSYDNFKRTIIIPQGQFQEFLQLGNKDRTQMMKELFNLEKFELYYKVTAVESKNNEQIQHIQGQLQQLGEIEPDKIRELEEKLLLLKKELDDLAESLNIKQKREVQFQQILDLSKKLEAAKISLSQLQIQESEFAGLEKNIVQYENCILLFKNLLDTLEKSNLKIRNKTGQIKTDTEKLAQEESEIAANEKKLNEIKPAYEKREILKQRAEELQKLWKIKLLNNKIENENDRLLKGNAIFAETINNIENRTKERQSLTENIKDEKLKLPDFMLLSAIKSWHVEKQNLDKQRRETELEINKTVNGKAEILNSVQPLIKEIIPTGLEEIPSPQNAIDLVQAKFQELKTRIKKLESEAGHLNVKAQLEKYAEDLTEGLPCPLCGSTHHPEIYSSSDLQNEQEKIEKEKQKLESEEERFSETLSSLNNLNQQLKLNNEILEEKTNKSYENKVAAEKHALNFKWPGFENPEKIEHAFAEAESLKKKIQDVEDELEKCTAELEKSGKNKDRFQEEIVKIKTQLTISETEKRTLQEQLKLIRPEEYAHIPGEEIEAEGRLLLQQYENLEKQFSSLTENLAALRKNKDMLVGIVSATQKELEQEQEFHKSQQTAFVEQLKKTEFESLEEVQKVLSQSIDLAREKQRIAEFMQNLALAKIRVGELRDEMGERHYHAEDHQKLVAEIEQVKHLQNTKNQEKGKTEEGLNTLRKDLENQAILKLAFEKLELRAENLKTLKSLFKASGFVNYISSVYLQNLCNAANDRFFQLTRQKLSLEITADNNFEVRDFMNGGKVRNVKTLSGGQTFQAALSLALALADNIQKITESNQNFFFLDEGFGSLDKESLSVVFETLKSLRRENRIVGVISHVEEMQQEIDVHLRIENRDDAGSLIFSSWAE